MGPMIRKNHRLSTQTGFALRSPRQDFHRYRTPAHPERGRSVCYSGLRAQTPIMGPNALIWSSPPSAYSRSASVSMSMSVRSIPAAMSLGIMPRTAAGGSVVSVGEVLVEVGEGVGDGRSARRHDCPALAYEARPDQRDLSLRHAAAASRTAQPPAPAPRHNTANGLLRDHVSHPRATITDAGRVLHAVAYPR